MSLSEEDTKLVSNWNFQIIVICFKCNDTNECKCNNTDIFTSSFIGGFNKTNPNDEVLYRSLLFLSKISKDIVYNPSLSNLFFSSWMMIKTVDR